MTATPQEQSAIARAMHRKHYLEASDLINSSSGLSKMAKVQSLEQMVVPVLPVSSSARLQLLRKSGTLGDSVDIRLKMLNEMTYECCRMGAAS